MSTGSYSRNEPGEPHVYQIRVKGHLDPERAAWFGATAISLEGSGDTLLTFELVDQAALHGLLRKVRDSGMTLISVNPASPGQSDMTQFRL